MTSISFSGPYKRDNLVFIFSLSGFGRERGRGGERYGGGGGGGYGGGFDNRSGGVSLLYPVIVKTLKACLKNFSLTFT